MSSFAVLLLCVQACLVQTVFGQYGCGCGVASAPIAVASAIAPSWGALSYPGSYPASYSATSYGGVGEGNVAVVGELPVAGTTAVAGQVPILGAVTFAGSAPAAGAVSIVGNCACGCGY